MTEPDFDQIARTCLAAQGVHDDLLGEEIIKDALRQVWNARGAADVVAVEAQFHGSELNRAIKALDR